MIHPRENGSTFFGILMLVVAWRIASGLDGSWIALIIAVYLALIGVAQIIDAVRVSEAVRGPRPFSGLPPLWLVGWVLLLAWAFLIGTPHLRVDRDYRGSGYCLYAGWNGNVLRDGGNCPFFALVPLGVRNAVRGVR